jgi:glycosyltransferase involved in cell wall biosynthesis
VGVGLVVHKARLAMLTTSVLQVKFFLVPHLKALAEKYDVTLLVKNDHPEILASLDLPVRIQLVSIERQVSPLKDLQTLWALFCLFRAGRFDMVHTVNPKAGLLGILAAWLARIPVRLHTFQGETWANKKGLWRFILRSMDKAVGLFATHLTVVSESERQVLVSEGLIPTKKTTVLANGSIGGVNLDLFYPQPIVRARLREQLGYVASDVVLLFMGRLTHDKGVFELATAFERLASQCDHAKLLLVGPDEGQVHAYYAPLLSKLGNRIQLLPYTAQPHDMMQVADVLVLPSHREGFGVVVIEAAALGIPAVASRIYGISDAMVDNETGLMFEKQNVSELQAALFDMCTNEALRKRLGQQAQRRVLEQFSQTMVIQAFLDYYRTLLAGRA